MNQLSPIEEFDIKEDIISPHLKYTQITLSAKKDIANSILNRKHETLLLISAYGFELSSVVAGLTKEAVEYLAKNAPKNYKENLLSVFENTAEIKDLILIANSMDNDLGRNSTQNQDRIRNVIQYIKDNRIAFEF